MKLGSPEHIYSVYKSVLVMFFLGFSVLTFGFVYIANRLDIAMRKMESICDRLSNLEMQKFIKRKKK